MVVSPLLLLLSSAAFAQTVAEPQVIPDTKAMKSLCDALRVEHLDEEGEAVEVDLDQAVFGKVYRISVDPQTVRFRTYEPKGARLPIALEKGLSAFEGGVNLGVMDQRGAAFSVSSAVAEGLVKEAEEKRLALFVDFMIDEELAAEVSPCFSYPKSESFSLRIAPLAYEVRDAKGATLARVRTDRMKELASRMPEERAVSIEPRVWSGVVDQTQLVQAAETARPKFEACVAGKAGAVGMTAAIRNGRFDDVRVEIDGMEAGVATCLTEALSGLAAPKASSGARVGFAFSVEMSPR